MSRLASQRMPVFLALLVACGESKRVVDSALASSAGTGGTGVGGAAEYADFGELGTPGCDVPSPDLAPDRFTIGDDGPHAVALSGSKLVLTTPSGLGVMSKDGTDFELIASFRPTCGEGCSGGLDVEALAVDVDTAFFGVDGDLFQSPLAGGEPVLLAEAVGTARAADANDVYTLGDSVFVTSRSTGSVTVLGPRVDASDLAIGPDYVYFAALTKSVAAGTPVESALYRAPRDGGDVTELARFPGYFPGAIAVDGGFAYVGAGGTAFSPWAVLRVPLGGGEPLRFAWGGRSKILVDGGNLYFFDSDSASSCLKKKPLAGGEPTVLALWPGSGDGLVADETHLFFTNGYFLMRLAKP